MCISKLTIIGSDKWLVAWRAPSCYLNQCWNIVSWTLGNKLQWIFHQNWYIFIQENPFEYVVWKMAAILSRLQCVNYISIVVLPEITGIESSCNNHLNSWGLSSTTGVDNNTLNPSQIYLIMKSYSVSSSHNIDFSWQILLKFCTEQGSMTAVLCAKFQKDAWTKKVVMDRWYLSRFEFKMDGRHIGCIVMSLRNPQ